MTRVFLAIDGTLAYLAPLRILCSEGHAAKITLIRIQLEPLAPEMAALGLAEVRLKGGLWTRKKLSLPKSPAVSPMTAGHPPSSVADSAPEEPTPLATTRAHATDNFSGTTNFRQAVAPTIPTTMTNEVVGKPFIICIIDGSSVFFPPELINESRSGGLTWASRLERLLRGTELANSSQAILTVTLVCDLNELKSSLLYTWKTSAKSLDGFLEGFTQHAETFSIRNVRTAEAPQVLQGELSTCLICRDY